MSTTSGNEDQNQRNTPVMEDSPSMRIEFLRARLLSERSVSRTAKQRADELTKRVAELEEQLKTVTLQRKKAEKATATVLSILENHGIGDASDGFDSGSDQDDAALCESNVSDSKDWPKEASTERNMEARDNDGETYSSSEIESSPSTGRSLSWKSDRESLRSSNRKKYIDSARRSSSFASAGTSSKHVGKSCRRIRRKETRSTVEESYSDTSMDAARDNSGTTRTQNRDGLEHHAKSGQLDTLEGEEDMEKALQNQAKLIGQYEAEERAQSEWEEKYRENPSFMPDSCDLGTHSDVTEERYDMKASEQPSSSKTLCSEPPNDMRSPKVAEMKCNKTVVSESSSPEFAFPVSKGNLDSENNAHTPPYSAVSGNPSENASSSSDGSNLQKRDTSRGKYELDGSNLQKRDTSRGKYELALVSHETNKNVRNVLDALEQAKVSLRQKLNSLPHIEAGGPSIPAGGRAEIPGGCPALFRLPIDLQWDTISKPGYSSLPLQFSMANRSPETALVGNTFSSIPTNPTWSPMYDPTVNTSLPPSTRSNFFDPQPSTGSPFSSNHSFPNYHFSPAMIPPQLSSPIGFSATLPGRENETTSATCFALYDDHIRPHMHR